MINKKLTLKILLFLVLSDCLETFTHFCFKKSALTQSAFVVRGLNDTLIFIQAMFSCGFLWVGLLSVAATFIIWSIVLSKIDLSVAVPIASFSYILVALVSIIFLHENITPLRWIGIFFILSGVVFVSLSTERRG